MLEIFIEHQRTFNLRKAISESVESGDYDSLYDDIRDCFTEEQVEEIEEILELGDIGESIDDIVNEWNGEDTDELLNGIRNFFGEMKIDIQFIYDEDLFEEPEIEIDYPDDADIETPDDEYDPPSEDENF